MDLVSIERFERDLEANLRQLQSELISGQYRPQPVKRIFVPKAQGGLRPLALWTLRDKIAQRVVYDCIEPVFETQFLDCSYGFRPGRSVQDAVEQVMAHRDQGRCWVVDADIDRCFDSIDGRLLMKFISRQVKDKLLLELLEGWLKARIFNSLDGGRAMAGASQGGVISPLLCNVYLHQFDLDLTRRKLCLVRFADDFLILCRRKKGAQRALKAVEDALSRIRLGLNPHKTRLVHFDQGFKFLGVFFLRNEHFYL